MKKKLNCILLVDDNEADNFLHRYILKDMNVAEHIAVAENGLLAMEYLQNSEAVCPDIIFLDINMPKMNGWEFLEAYKDLDVKQKAKIIIVLLTTSQNPEDYERAKTIAEVNGFNVKPLTADMMTEILAKHFAEYLD